MDPMAIPADTIETTNAETSRVILGYLLSAKYIKLLSLVTQIRLSRPTPLWWFQPTPPIGFYALAFSGGFLHYLSAVASGYEERFDLRMAFGFASAP
jgi:hypothetical protein